MTIKTTKMEQKIREVFNSELIKYSDSLFQQLEEFNNSECFVVLTEDLLNFLNANFESFEFIENYSDSIGQTVYISFYGDSIFPLDNLKKQLEKMDLEN